MKQWNKENKPEDFYNIIDPLINAVLFSYQLVRQNQGKNIPYDGMDIGDNEKATCLSPDVLFNSSHIETMELEYDKSLIDTIICLAVQLGIEQGRRIYANDRKNTMKWAMVCGALANNNISVTPELILSIKKALE